MIFLPGWGQVWNGDQEQIHRQFSESGMGDTIMPKEV